MVKVKIGNRSIYYDGYLQSNLDLIKGLVKKDWDILIIVTGLEGCLTGDTIINVNRNELGRKYKLEYLYKQFNNKIKKKQWKLNNPSYVRSFNGKEIRLHKIKNVFYSGHKEVYQIELKNGKKIKATPNHKFLTTNGWLELKSLLGKKIMVDRSKKKHIYLHSENSYKNFNQSIPDFSEVISIKKIGFQDVYDIECEEPNHNFIANGIIAHNSGKSVFCMQNALYLDPTFDISRVAFNPPEFKKAVLKAKKFQAVVYDEGFAISSRTAISIVNISIISMLSQIRQKNLFVFVVLPSFFELDRYLAMHRSLALLHVYTGKDFRRGFFSFYNVSKKKELYIRGKKTYSFPVKPNFRGRFTNAYAINEKEYRKKKLQSLEQEISYNPQDKSFDRYYSLVKGLIDIKKWKYKEVKDLMNELTQYKITENTLRKMVMDIRRRKDDPKVRD